MLTVTTRSASLSKLLASLLLALAALAGLGAADASARAAGPGQIVFVAGKAEHCKMGAGRNFDVVRSIAVVGNAVYVGTDAGLQVYDGADFALEHARLVTLAANGSATSPTIERVGESCDAAGTAVACGPRGCTAPPSRAARGSSPATG